MLYNHASVQYNHACVQHTYASVLYNELKKKFPAKFANYIDADFLAWVMLFDAPSSVVSPRLHPDSRLVSSPVQVSGKATKVHTKLTAQIKARMRTKDEFQALPVAQQSGKALFKDLVLD